MYNAGVLGTRGGVLHVAQLQTTGAHQAGCFAGRVPCAASRGALVRCIRLHLQVAVQDRAAFLLDGFDGPAEAGALETESPAR